MHKKSGLLLSLLAVAWLLAGCARSGPVAYYQLTAIPLEHQAVTARPPTDTVIGLGPLTLPEYLDRSQIVSRRAPNRLELADLHRWAGPLGDNIARVLQENLARALGNERVLLYPWGPALGVDRQITVEILHCETGDDEVLFEASWTLQDRDGKILILQRRSSQRIKVTPPAEYDQQVAALSEALARFSGEMATGLGGMAAEPGGKFGDKP
jgi:uncharacterized lipoprotein YmbA